MSGRRDTPQVRGRNHGLRGVRVSWFRPVCRWHPPKRRPPSRPKCRGVREPESRSGAHGRGHDHLRLLPPCLTLAVACSLWCHVGHGVGVVVDRGRAWVDGMGVTGGIGCPGTGPPSVPWFASARTIIVRRACIRRCAMGSVTTVITSCRVTIIRLRICSG